MVRIKNRYMLVQILYPSSSLPRKEDSVKSGGATNELPLLDSSLAQAPEVQPERSLEDIDERSTILGLCAPATDAITIPLLLRLLRATLLSLFGDHGSAAASSGLSIKYWSKATSKAILRCDRAAFRMVWVACTFIKSMRIYDGSANTEVPCVFQVLHVSGTIKKCEEEAIRKNRAIFREVQGLDAHSGAESNSSPIFDVGYVTDRSEDRLHLSRVKPVETGSERNTTEDDTLDVDQ